MQLSSFFFFLTTEATLANSLQFSNDFTGAIAHPSCMSMYGINILCWSARSFLCDSLIAPMAAPSCQWIWRSSADGRCNDPKLDEWKYRSRAFASRRDPPTDWKAIKDINVLRDHYDLECDVFKNGVPMPLPGELILDSVLAQILDQRPVSCNKHSIFNLRHYLTFGGLLVQNEQGFDLMMKPLWVEVDWSGYDRCTLCKANKGQGQAVCNDGHFMSDRHMKEVKYWYETRVQYGEGSCLYRKPPAVPWRPKRHWPVSHQPPLPPAARALSEPVPEPLPEQVPRIHLSTIWESAVPGPGTAGDGTAGDGTASTSTARSSSWQW